MPNKKKIPISTAISHPQWTGGLENIGWGQVGTHSAVELENSEDNTIVLETQEYKNTIPESPVNDIMDLEERLVKDMEDMTEDEFVDANKDATISAAEDIKEDNEYINSVVVDESIIAEDEVIPEQSSSKNKAKEDKYLIFACIQCPRAIQVRYPYTGYKKVQKEFKCDSFCIIAYTTCKRCLVSGQNNSFVEDIATQRKDSIDGAYMSSSSFIGSTVYKCAVAISDTTPTILTHSDFVRYIPVTQISSICTNATCKASTLDVETCKAMDYLEFGFLP